MFDLKGKKVLLTGATGSIGISIAKKLSEVGAIVALTGTRIEKLNEISNEFNEVLKKRDEKIVQIQRECLDELMQMKPLN